ncbi:juvenile hormone epoxide hydrolase 1-like [Anopheles bellator]|uniref:juvenile hormone epoxide hydrolase 1-like n=1 Tax=Anopheles bellator TaxID=139047 RepID=UPI002648B94D|nr:juvenile hormone epoxide hydrolase 1-like [Anopheles bellator]
MGLARQFLVLFVACCSLWCYTLYCDLTKPLPVPQLNLDEYWGPGEAAKYREDTQIRPFDVSYNASVLLTLRRKLNDLPKLTPPLEDAGPFEYGFNSDRLKEILHYWRTNYLERWRDRERYLNQFPHFKTQIQGLDVHFIHVRPTEVHPSTKVLPLLLLHGWPGSVREFYELIPRLTKPLADERNFVFEVIAPSLPGYGWSQGSAKKGLGAKNIAVIMKNLMARVGHKRFYVHGGDWGALVTDLMGTFFQEDIIGMHQSGCGVAGTLATVKTIIASFAPSYFIEEQYIPFYYPFETYFHEMVLESGYMHLQATKPDTIGTVLVGNPVGLAAYILEKFSTWTNKEFRTLTDGGLEKFFTLDALLDNVMIYYLTDSITTSQRLYAEVFSVDDLFSGELGRMTTVVPSACAKFRHDLLHTIDWALRDHYRNLIQSNHYEDGGHFSSMQLPEVMYKDLVQFVEKVEILRRA